MNKHHTHTETIIHPFFPPCCITQNHTHTLGCFNVGKHTLEDQMDLMNTLLLTSWVCRPHTLGDQMDFGEIHMTTS